MGQPKLLPSLPKWTLGKFESSLAGGSLLVLLLELAYGDGPGTTKPLLGLVYAMVPDLMLPCAIGRGLLSGTGRWTVMGAVAIDLFKFGEYAFGAAIGLFTFSVG